MVNFGGNKIFSNFYLVYNRLFQNFTTNAAKVRNGYFWTILNKFRVVDFYMPQRKFLRTSFVRQSSPKYPETINMSSSQKFFKLCIKLLFCVMSFDVTCFMIGSKNCILKICDIYLNSK